LSGSPVIPKKLSPLESLYKSLGDRAKREQGVGEQEHHLRVAKAMTAKALVTAFLQSVEHYGDYRNDQRFYPDNRARLTEAKHRPTTDADLQTSSIAWWLADKDPQLRHPDGSEVGMRYVDRELVPLRTQGYGEDMSSRSRRSRRLDLLLRASEGRPVIAEVKAKTDQHPFYGFIQALMHVSQLSSPAQRKRLSACYPDLQTSGPVDVCLILAGNAHYFFEPQDGWKRKPKFKPQLADEARRLCEGLTSDRRAEQFVRTIRWLEGSMVCGNLVFSQRFAYPAKPLGGADA
jgi:hypothetical protein